MAISKTSPYPIFLGTDSYDKLKTGKKLALLEEEFAGIAHKETDPLDEVVHRLGIENLKNIQDNTKDNDYVDDELKKNVRFYYFLRSAACYFNGEEIEQRLLEKDNCIKRCFRKICCCKGFERKLEKTDRLKQVFQENFLKESKNDEEVGVEEGDQENGKLDSLLESEAYKALIDGVDEKPSAYDQLKLIRTQVEQTRKKYEKSQDVTFSDVFLETGEREKKIQRLLAQYNNACKRRTEKYQDLKETLDTLRESIDEVLQGDHDFSKQDLRRLYEVSKIWYEFHTILTQDMQGAPPPPVKNNKPYSVNSKAKNELQPVKLVNRTHKEPLIRHKPLKDEDLNPILTRGEEIVNLPGRREALVEERKEKAACLENLKIKIGGLSGDKRLKKQDELNEQIKNATEEIAKLDKQIAELDKKIPKIKDKNEWKGLSNPLCNCFLNTALWMLFEVCPDCLDLTKPLPDRIELTKQKALINAEFLPYTDLDKEKFEEDGPLVFGAFVTTEPKGDTFIPEELIVNEETVKQCRKTREAFRILVREAYDCVRSGNTFTNGAELRRLAYYCGVVESADVSRQEVADECFSRLLMVLGGTEKYNNFHETMKATTSIYLPSEVMKEFKFDKRNKVLKKLNQDYKNEFEKIAKLKKPKSGPPRKTETFKLEACTINNHNYKEVDLQEYVMTDDDEIAAAEKLEGEGGVSFSGTPVDNDGDGGCQVFAVDREGMSIEDVLKEATQQEDFIVNSERLQYRKLLDELGNEQVIAASYAIKKTEYELKDGKYPDQLGFTFKSDANGQTKAVALYPKFKPKFGNFTFEEWYELKSVMIHTGNVKGGHWYYAEYLGNGYWLKKNDNRISVVSEKEIDLSRVKFVLYKKCERD